MVNVSELVELVAADRLSGLEPDWIAGRIGVTIVQLTARAVDRVAAGSGVDTVALAGGVWHSPWLEQMMTAALARYRVLIPRRIPVGDGGLSLGQAVVAAMGGGV